PAMQKHQRGSPATDNDLDAVWRAYHALTPNTPVEQAFYSESIRRLNELDSTRAERIEAAGAQLPAVLWGVLLVGGIITVGFTYFFGLQNLRANILMVTALAAIIGLTLFLIISLDLPYSGDLSVKPSSMQRAVIELRHFEAQAR